MQFSIVQKILERLVLEGRYESVLAQAFKQVPEFRQNDVRKIADNDPSGKDKLKYTMWGVSQLMKDEDPDEVVDVLANFHRSLPRLQQKDVNSYATLADMRDAVEALGQSKTQQKTQIKGEADRVYEDDNFVVVKPRTTAASCTYGAGTKWCIASGISTNYFNSYSGGNWWFYFIIRKGGKDSDVLSKIAFPIANRGTRLASEQFRDREDRLVPLENIVKYVGPAWPAMLEAMKADARASGDSPQYLAKSELEKMRTWLEDLRQTDDLQEIRAGFEKGVAHANPAIRKEILGSIARNRHAPTEYLRRIFDMIKRQQLDVSTDTILTNPNCPPEIMEALAKDPFVALDTYTGQQVVQNYVNNLDDASRNAYFRKALTDPRGALTLAKFTHLLGLAKNRDDILAFKEHSTTKPMLVLLVRKAAELGLKPVKKEAPVGESRSRFSLRRLFEGPFDDDRLRTKVKDKTATGFEDLETPEVPDVVRRPGDRIRRKVARKGPSLDQIAAPGSARAALQGDVEDVDFDTSFDSNLQGALAADVENELYPEDETSEEWVPGYGDDQRYFQTIHPTHGGTPGLTQLEKVDLSKEVLRILMDEFVAPAMQVGSRLLPTVWNELKKLSRQDPKRFAAQIKSALWQIRETEDRLFEKILGIELPPIRVQPADGPDLDMRERIAHVLRRYYEVVLQVAAQNEDNLKGAFEDVIKRAGQKNFSDAFTMALEETRRAEDQAFMGLM